MPFSNRAEKERWYLLAELVHPLLFQQAVAILTALLPAVHSYFLFLVHGNEPMSLQYNKQVPATDNS